LSQLLAIICYCDLTDFSKIWSATFRPNTFNQSLNEIKKRNQKFYFCSKHLIEIVNVFGISCYENNPNGKEKGPYFCGLNCSLTFPSYNLRLTAPCSTTKQLSVATKFSDQQGVIVKLSNYNSNLHFFNCSWLSSFGEEEERLFIAGNIPIRIINITNVFDGKQYSRVAKVLSAADDVLNGVSIDYIDHSLLKAEDMKYMSQLFKHLSDPNDSELTDLYLIRSLMAYQSNKHQIVIVLRYLYKYKSNVKENLLNMFFHGGIKRYESDNADVSDLDSSNIVNVKYLVSCFKNLKKIIIHTTDNGEC